MIEKLQQHDVIFFLNFSRPVKFLFCFIIPNQLKIIKIIHTKRRRFGVGRGEIHNVNYLRRQLDIENRNLILKKIKNNGGSTWGGCDRDGRLGVTQWMKFSRFELPLVDHDEDHIDRLIVFIFPMKIRETAAFWLSRSRRKVFARNENEKKERGLF